LDSLTDEGDMAIAMTNNKARFRRLSPSECCPLCRCSGNGQLIKHTSRVFPGKHTHHQSQTSQVTLAYALTAVSFQGNRRASWNTTATSNVVSGQIRRGEQSPFRATNLYLPRKCYPNTARITLIIAVSLDKNMKSQAVF
jgi:hypothetical protein